jgi:ferredoxin
MTDPSKAKLWVIWLLSMLQKYTFKYFLFDGAQKFRSVVVIFALKFALMAIMITDECINCGACEPECPNNAIYEGGAEWKFADGTSLKGLIETLDGDQIEASHAHEPVNMDVYYIAHEKCTECVGFHDEPQCAAVCPVDCCVDDPDYRESEDELLAKKNFMHL